MISYTKQVLERAKEYKTNGERERGRKKDVWNSSAALR